MTWRLFLTPIAPAAAPAAAAPATTPAPAAAPAAATKPSTHYIYLQDFAMLFYTFQILYR
ncbi:hypothetical protein FXW07_17015 [Methanosarcina sp. DH1]|nr:hypothetical protein [Methanosarcina sp. DH1]